MAKLVIKRTNRAKSLLYKYGLTEDVFKRIIKHQQNLCPICKTSLYNNHKMVVDHDHVSGLVRGILHDKCNKALGQFNDSSIVLKRAAHYLLSRHLVIRKWLCPKYLYRKAAKANKSTQTVDNKGVNKNLIQNSEH